MRYSPDLIIDVGMCDGTDTAYYLHKGYRVLAIEADPMLCQRACLRFSDALRESRLELLNIGIGRETGRLKFYRNLTNLGQSSFDAGLGQAGGRYEEMWVSIVPLASILETHGVPFYLKMDIEGYDEIALSTLGPWMAPPYISAEMNFAESILDKLAALGYLEFKLINQDFHTSSLEIADDEPGWRLLRKAGRTFPPFRSLIKALPQAWRPRTEWDRPYRPDGWDPQGGKFSGPFAEQSFGQWLSFEQAKAIFDYVKARHEDCWWDVHARNSAQPMALARAASASAGSALAASARAAGA